MVIDDTSFHDSQILKVTENPALQAIDFLISFPVSWEENNFEDKILRFEKVIAYNIDEIPYHGLPTILDIKNLGQIAKIFGTGQNEIRTLCTKIKIETTAGDRFIVFDKCELLNI